MDAYFDYFSMAYMSRPLSFYLSFPFVSFWRVEMHKLVVKYLFMRTTYEVAPRGFVRK